MLSSAHKRNEPLGLQHAHARTSSSSLPSPYGPPNRSSSRGSRFSSRSRPLEKKRTKDGKFILDPQPDDSANDPLNWSKLRRDVALLSLGFYCMIGGGMTPLLAAGFNDVAKTYNVTVPQVALTTGFYMLGLGLGSVMVSPTAILFGKRPVYLIGIIVFLLSAVWCALSPNCKASRRILSKHHLSDAKKKNQIHLLSLQESFRVLQFPLLSAFPLRLLPRSSFFMNERTGWGYTLYFF